MKLHFAKVNPVENMTIFVMDPLPRENHFEIANKLMNYNSVHAEQVGFIETTNNGDMDKSFIRLQMMGGEFCGNATRSLAALMVHNQYPQGIEKVDGGYNVELYTSGLDNDVIKCFVQPTEEAHTYYSRVKMPDLIDISDLQFDFEGNNIDTIRVDFPGMTHFIVDSTKLDDKNNFYELVKEFMADEEYDAFGIMFFNYETEFLDPLVYVRSTDSLFWERSCGSGSSALAAALSYENKEDIKKSVKQPGGELEITASYNDGKINNIYLNGLVDIVSEGIVNL